MSVKEELSWYRDILKLTQKLRVALKNLVLKHLVVDSRSKNKNPKFNNEMRVEFAKQLMKEKDVEFIGFVKGLEYIRATPYEGCGADQLKDIFVHPFGSYTLAYWNKTVGCVMLVNPYMRFNQGKLHEISENKDQPFYSEMKDYLGLNG